MELKFFLSYILILIPLILLYRENVGLERELLISSVRAFLQLVILGYALLFILRLENLLGLTAILFTMVLFATFTANRRISILNGYRIAFLSISISSVVVIGSTLLVGVLSLKANELIPIGGMIIGNALNSYTQTIERFKSEVKGGIEITENFLALGTPLKEAFRLQIKASVKASLIPIINNLQTLGIIWIPGITAGMVLAGANPIKAVFFQIVVMFIMVCVAVLTSYIATNLSYKRILWEL